LRSSVRMMEAAVAMRGAQTKLCVARFRNESGKCKMGCSGIRGIAIQSMMLPNTFRWRIGK